LDVAEVFERASAKRQHWFEPTPASTVHGDENRMKDTTLHLVGNAHIDPVWLWTAVEGRQEVIDTCRSALDRMEETAEFVFCRSSAATYQWLEEIAPAIFREVQQRVAEGRWIPVGGWWVQPDCNIPSGESLVRQGIVGKSYFSERFGVDVAVGYNVDSFGHAWTLPQIMAGMGLRYYVFFRPGPHEKELPGWVFWWEAPDGSRVLAARPPGHYNTGPEDIAERIQQAADTMPEGLREGLAFYGVGNHGGGPTKRNIASIITLRERPDLPRLKFSHPQAFFEAALASQTDFPVVRDELQYHARGCYTSLTAIKTANRAAENALLSAELWTTLARTLVGDEIDQRELQQAWETVLFNQFHDILAGTSIRAACDEALSENQLIIDRSNNKALRAARRLAASVNTSSADQREALIVFNPLGWERQDPVSFEVNWRASEPGLTVESVGGRQLPSQVLESCWSGGGRSVRGVVETKVGPCGYTTLWVSPGGDPPPGRGEAPTTRVMDNGVVRVEFGDGAEWVKCLKDLEEGIEVAGPGCAGLVVLEDPSDTWSHGVDRFDGEVGAFEVIGEPAVVEWGPIRWTVRLAGRWGRSRAWQDFSLTRGRKQVDVRLALDWHEEHRILKLRVPTRLRGGEATFEIPYGAIVRPPTGDEEPAQRWVDLSGRLGCGGAAPPYGVALLNDSRYGFDVRDAEIRMSVVRSPIYAFHDPAEVVADETYEYTDQGRHVVRYAIVPHRGTWREAAVVRRAAELNRPCLVLQEPVHEGVLPPAYAFVATDCPTVDVEAVKPAERGSATVVRLRETAGRDTNCRLLLAGSQTFDLSFRAWEIKTLALSPSDGEWCAEETDLLERPLADREGDPCSKQ